ncbi:MAG: PD40 domain-containing protein, partial [Pirellulaceae bacterium]|nr:PD40 domain-containing protein [Pirellulaceae bacterium]
MRSYLSHVFSPRKKNRKLQKRRALFRPTFEQLEDRRLLAGDLALIDVDPTGAPVYGKTAVVGDKLYYADTDLQHGTEIHVLDAMADTTSIVADINPGFGDSYAGQYGFAVVGTKLYFSAYDPTNGHELRWIDTSAVAPTVNTLDIHSGSNGSYAGQYGGFTAVGTKLYFSASDATSGDELRWIDTAAAEPTVNTLDIHSGSGSSSAGAYGGFTLVDTKLYFTAYDPTNGQELRWIDTTVASPTVNSLDINSGSDSSYAGQFGGFTPLGTKLYFTAYDPTNGDELRWIDTTVASPIVNTLDIYSGSDGSNAGLLGGFATVGTKLYFTAADPTNGYELRWIDTSAASPTVNTLDIYSGGNSSSAGQFGGFTAVGTKLYFTAYDPTNGYELRWIDTTVASPTVTTLDIYSGGGSSNAGLYGGFMAVGAKLYFRAFDPTNGYELRWIDTTVASPSVETPDISSGSGSFVAGARGGFTLLGTKLYFTAPDSTGGYELRWIDTMAAAPIVNTLDLYSGGNSSHAGQYGGFAAVGTKLYFSAYDQTNGTELRWIDTSAASPTVNTLDLYSGSDSSYAGQFGGFTAVGTKLYFTAYDPTSGYELRWIDTTVASPTVNTLDIYNGANHSNAGYYGGFTAVGTKLYFSAQDATYGHELRWIDTTAAEPTVNTLDMYSGGGSSDAGRFGGFTAVGTKLYFTAYSWTSGYELRWIDTTAAEPTANTLDIHSGHGDSVAGQYGGFTAVGTKLYFTAYDPNNGDELRWIDTAVASPTVTTLDIYSGGGSSAAGQHGGFTAVGAKLYFTAYEPTNGSELRWIDTTAASPIVNTLDISSGSGGSGAGAYGGFTAVGTKLYFSASDATSGREVRWIDTTAVSLTVNTQDIYSGNGSSNAGQYGGFTAVGTKLYFSAYKAGFGVELFSYTDAIASLTASLNSGNLTITDTDGTGKNNDLTVKLVNVAGTDYVEITDAAEQFASAPTTSPPSTLSNGDKTLTVPLSAITGSITVSTADGEDTLTIDFSGGDFPVPIHYAGGDPATGASDRLVLTGGTFADATFTSNGSSSGTVNLTGNATISYSGMEELASAVEIANLTLKYSASSEQIAISNPGGWQTFAETDAGGRVLFNNPSTTLHVDSGDGYDQIHLISLQSGYPAGLFLGRETDLADFVSISGMLNTTSDVSVAADQIVVQSGSMIETMGSGDITLRASQIELSGNLNASGQLRILPRGDDSPLTVNIVADLLLQAQTGAIQIGDTDDFGGLTIVGANLNSPTEDLFIETSGMLSIQTIVSTMNWDEWSNPSAPYPSVTLRGSELHIPVGGIVDADGTLSVLPATNGWGLILNLANSGALQARQGPIQIGDPDDPGGLSIEGAGLRSPAHDLFIETSGSMLIQSIVTTRSDDDWSNPSAPYPNLTLRASELNMPIGAIVDADGTLSVLPATNGWGLTLHLSDSGALQSQQGPIRIGDPDDPGGLRIAGSGLRSPEHDLFIETSGPLAIETPVTTKTWDEWSNPSAPYPNVTLRGSELNIPVGGMVDSDGFVSVLPATDGTGLVVNLSDDWLLFSPQGPIQIGDANSAGNVVIGGAGVTSESGLNIASLGSIFVDSPVTSPAGADIHFVAQDLFGNAPILTAGQITVDSNVVFNASSIFHADLSGTFPLYGQMHVLGDARVVALADVALDVSLSFAPPVGEPFVIIDNEDPASTVLGEFYQLPDGSVFDVNGQPFQIDYQGGDGNDVTLTVYGPGSIRGQKFHDVNGNGQRDPGEPGLDDWTIELVDRATGHVLEAQQTISIDWDGIPGIDPETEQGLYQFDSFPPGDYVVREVQQAGWVQTSPTGGGAGKIAFVRNDNGNSDIFVMDSDGSNLTRVTYGIFGADAVTWSPDGAWLAFRAVSGGNYSDLFIVDASGIGTPVNITNTPDYDELAPDWSPNGSLLVYGRNPVSGGSEDIFTVQPDGFGLTQLTSGPEREFDPAWSPDGSKIAFTSFDPNTYSTVIQVMNADGTGPFVPIASGFQAVWSPDGTKIAYTGFSADPLAEIFVTNADGSGLGVQLTSNSFHDGEPTWSSDGTSIVFSSDRAGDPDLYVMPADGSGPATPLTSGPAHDRGPDFWSLEASSGGVHTVTLAAGQLLDGLNFGNMQAASEIGSIHGFTFNDADGNRVYNPPVIAPDNGFGTADLPVPDSFFRSRDWMPVIVDGLPSGTEVIGRATLDRVENVVQFPGGLLGGGGQQFDGMLRLELLGSGELEGWHRVLSVPVSAVTHSGPRTVGDPIQSFDTEMVQISGELVSDPDFELVRITAGTDFGLPSPGHTTLSQLPGGDWNVDGFLDITYRIDFVGSPGGSLAGQSGSTTGGVHMSQGGSDSPMPGIEIQLNGDVNGDGFPDIVPALSDQQGAFHFSDLHPGTFTLQQVNLPLNRVQTTPWPEPWTELTVGGGEAWVWQDGAAMLPEGDPLDEVFFGEPLMFGSTQLQEIRGWKFEDINGNGDWDEAEPGIAGWPITLTGVTGTGWAVSINAVTMLDDPNTPEDETGQYGFTGLWPGEYHVDEDPMSPWIPSRGIGGYDLSLTGSLDVPVALDALTQEFNFGNYLPGAIHGYKFNDLNANGLDDAEPRWAGVTVTLVGDVDGDGIADTLIATTDDNGEYGFEGLRPGAYLLTETPLPGSVPTTSPSAAVTISSGEAVVAHAGQAQLGSSLVRHEFTGTVTSSQPGWADVVPVGSQISGFFVYDTSLPDSGAGSTVGVYGLSSPVSFGPSRVMFTAGGMSFVNDLNERLQFVVFDNYVYPGQSPIDEFFLGSFQDVIVSPSSALPADLAAGDINLVFGLHDDTASALNSDLLPLSLDPTAFGDFYGFVDGYSFSSGSTRFNYTLDLLAVAPSEQFETVNAALAFGDYYEQASSISGQKFEDVNGNGVQDLGGSGVPVPEIVLASVGPVVLTRNDDGSTDLLDFGFTFDFYGTPYTQFYLNNNGNISFDSPLSQFTPDGFPQTIAIVAPFWADVDTLNELSGEVHMTSGLSSRGREFIQIDWVDVGYYNSQADKLNDFTLYVEDDPDGDLVAFFWRNMQWTTGDASDGFEGFGGTGAQIGFDSGDGASFISLGRPRDAAGLLPFQNTSYVFRVDSTGVPQQVERGLDGWTIQLVDRNTDDVVAEQTTHSIDLDGNGVVNPATERGLYRFGDVPTGEYFVREVQQTGWRQISPAASGAYLVDVPVGVISITDLDFGNQQLGSISGYKFEDLNGDGIRDEGEPGLSDWTIVLDRDADGQNLMTTTTDSDGRYEFANLEPGTYLVNELLQSGWAQSLPPLGEYSLSLTASQHAGGLDFGNFVRGSVHGFAFDDANANGLLDEGLFVVDDAINVSGGPWPLSINSGISTAQTFTAGVSGTIHDVTLWLRNVSGSGYDLDVEIYDMAEGFPATRRAVTFVAGNSISADFAPHTFDFSSAGVAVSAGDVMAIAVRASGMPIEERFEWQISPFDPYAEGNAFQTVESSGGWSRSSDFDCDFAVRIATSVPIEAPLSDVPFRLEGTTGSGIPVDSVTATDSDGRFAFEGLLPGQYVVTQILPPGHTASTPLTYAFDLLSREELVAFEGQAGLPPEDPRMEVLVGAELMFGNLTNLPPVAVAGEPYVFEGGHDLWLDASGSFDPNEATGDVIVDYHWTFANGLEISTDSPTVTVAWNDLFTLPGPGVESLVMLRVTDSHGASGQAEAGLMYVDTTAPDLVPPPNQVFEATGPDGAIVHYPGAFAFDLFGPVLIDFSPPDSSLFPLGTFTIQVGAFDGSGNASFAWFDVSIVDTTPPVVVVPDDVTVIASYPFGAFVDFSPPVPFDLVDPNPTVVCEPPPGSLFPIGTTPVTVTAVDYFGNESSEIFHVTVLPPIALSIVGDHVYWQDHFARNDNWALSYAEGQLVFEDLAGVPIHTDIPGALGAGTSRVTVPAAGLNGPGASITVQTREGDDTLTIDLSGGDPIPDGGLTFDGGDAIPTFNLFSNDGDSNHLAFPGDSLWILGGDQGEVTYNYTNSHDGNIVMSNYGTVHYTGLEPITNSGSATDIVFNLPFVQNFVTLSDDGLVGNGMSRLSGPTFETTDFANPSGSVTINRGDSGDWLTVEDLPDFDAHLTIGNAAEPFGSVSLSGTMVLATGRNLSVTATSILAASSGNMNVTDGGSISLSSNNLAIDSSAAISAGNGIVAIKPFAGGQVDLGGADGAGIVGLTDTELDRISAGTIKIGDSSSGAISVSSAISPGGTAILHLVTGDVVTQTGAIAVGGLALEAAGGVSLLSTANAVTTLAGSTPGGAFVYHDSDGFDVGTVAGVAGVVAGGLVGLETYGGILTITKTTALHDVQATGFISIVNRGNGTLLRIDGGANLLTGSNVFLVGDRMDLQGTLTAPGGTAYLYNRSFQAIDLGSTTDVAINTLELSDAELDRITAETIQIGQGNSGTITISGSLTQPGKNLLLMTGTGVTGSGSLTTGAAAATTVTITQGGDSTFSGAFGGPGANENNFAVTKTGGGSLTLSGTNTHTGATTIAGGSLLVSGSTASGSAVTVNSTAALGGTGTAGGTVQVGSGGQLAPGASLGILNSGSVALADGSNFSIQINGTSLTPTAQYDRLNVAGTVALNNANLNVILGYTPAFLDSFTIIDNDGTDPVVGQFAGLAEGATLPLAGHDFRLSYVGGTGNDVVLSIPKPPPELLRFDFNASGSPTQQPQATPAAPDGYIGVLPTLAYTDATGFGWLGTPSPFDRGASASPAYSSLLRDGAWGSGPSDFQMLLAQGSYEVTVTLGDPSFARDRMNVTVVQGSGDGLTNVATAAGQLVHRSFTASPDVDGVLRLRFSDSGGDPYWTAGAVEVRPTAVSVSVARDGGDEPQPADGVTVDTFTVSGATAGAWYTLSIDRGTVTTTDQDPRYAGVQIQAPGESFAFTVLRGTGGGTANVRVEEVNGASRGSVLQPYLAILRYDFNYRNSDTAAGFVGVGDANKHDATLGYGWAATALGFDRTIGAPLLRDGHWGTDNTFLVDVPDGTYVVNVTLGDASFARNFINVELEGTAPASLSGLSSKAGQFVHASGQVTVVDGQLNVRVRSIGGDPYFTINALEIFELDSPAAPRDHGLSIDAEAGKVSGTANPGALVTVRSDRAAILPGQDSSPFYVGVQVQADAVTGEFELMFASPPSGGTVHFTSEEVTGRGGGAASHTFAVTGWRFDFNDTALLPADGFIGLGKTNEYDDVSGFGWQSNASAFDRGIAHDLLRDGHWGTSNTFLVDVPDGTYIVNVTLGDASFLRNHISVWAEGQLKLSGLTTAATQFLHRSFLVTVTDGQLNVQIASTGGDPYFTINALEVFPAQETPDPPRFDHDLQTADGVTFTGTSNAPDGSFVTVSTSLGSVTSADANPYYAGTQVVVNSGSFNFTVAGPGGGGLATIGSEEVTGKGKSSLPYNYAVPDVRRFDFNGRENVTELTTTPVFTGVRGGQAYDANLGYGWTPAGIQFQPVSEFQRGSAAKTSVALYRDGHWGSSMRTFQVAVVESTSYHVRVYVGDASFARDSIQVSVEGGAWQNVPNTAANGFATLVTSGSSTDSDGLLTISIRDAGGDPYWVINGIDVWQSTATDPAEAPLLASQLGSEMVGGWLTEAAVEAVLAAARDYWVSTGLSDAQLAELYRTPVAIGDLSYRGALGVSRPEGIWLDASGAGLGWSLGSGQWSV